MAATGAPAAGSGFGSTLRRDAWWVEVLPVIVLLGGFGLSATLRAFEGKFYEWGPYLSPFYSPLIDANHRWWTWSPAILILGGPLSFRATCYYYRKAYYRAFFLDPPSCAVGEPKRRYTGETKFPFLLQNLHRYALYLAIIFLFFLWKDAFHAFFFDGKFGMGVGTLVLSVNVCLLTIYTLSCHSLRHLAGGKLDCFSCASFGKARYAVWRGLTLVNERAMLFAWVSLFSVGLADFYVREVSSGAIPDVRIF